MNNEELRVFVIDYVENITGLVDFLIREPSTLPMALETSRVITDLIHALMDEDFGDSVDKLVTSYCTSLKGQVVLAESEYHSGMSSVEIIASFRAKVIEDLMMTSQSE